MRGITADRSLPLVVLVVLVALVWVVAFVDVGARGDGGEYLLETHALATHATPDIRVSDAEWLAQNEPSYRHLAPPPPPGFRPRGTRPRGGLPKTEPPSPTSPASSRAACGTRSSRPSVPSAARNAAGIIRSIFGFTR